MIFFSVLYKFLFDGRFPSRCFSGDETPHCWFWLFCCVLVSIGKRKKATINGTILDNHLLVIITISLKMRLDWRQKTPVAGALIVRWRWRHWEVFRWQWIRAVVSSTQKKWTHQSTESRKKNVRIATLQENDVYWVRRIGAIDRVDVDDVFGNFVFVSNIHPTDILF